MKSQRQAKIIEIISNTNVETQEQLLLQALQEAGFNSTQATISRDIKELRIVKELTSFGTYRYTTAARELSGTFSNRLNSIFKECVTGHIEAGQQRCHQKQGKNSLESMHLHGHLSFWCFYISGSAACILWIKKELD